MRLSFINHPTKSSGLPDLPLKSIALNPTQAVIVPTLGSMVNLTCSLGTMNTFMVIKVVYTYDLDNYTYLEISVYIREAVTND